MTQNKYISTPRVQKFRCRQRILSKLNEVILHLSIEQLSELENVLNQMKDSEK